jgi:glutaminase
MTGSMIDSGAITCCQIINSELPHARAMRLPDSSTMLTLTYGLILISSRAGAIISTGVYSPMRSTGILFIRVEALI